jgi:hypothetical protein
MLRSPAPASTPAAIAAVSLGNTGKSASAAASPSTTPYVQGDAEIS